MRATGMPDGQYTLGGLDVNVVGNRATLVSDGALAGSATNLLDCMRTAVKKMGLPLSLIHIYACCAKRLKITAVHEHVPDLAGAAAAAMVDFPVYDDASADSPICGDRIQGYDDPEVQPAMRG